MTQWKNAIDRWFADKQEELVEAVSRLVRIDSTLGEPQQNAPFGPGPAAALNEALTIAREWGLIGENLSGYVGTVDLNDRETALHILGHLDVVDPGEGWTMTEPFVPKLKDGILYGRGTDDDKGPMAASLFALRAVKELGIPCGKNVRVILGTDEETGFRDIHWYYENHPYAPATFSPDASFPITNTEKGHYQPTFTRSWPETQVLPRVTAIEGGPRINVVPAKAWAWVSGLTEQEIQSCADALDLEPELSFSLTREGEGICILCTGVQAHASTPEEGHNAQTALLSLLSALPLADCPSTRTIRKFHELFPHGDCSGTALGIAQGDTISGPLTLAFTRLSLTETGCEGRFDCRTPLCGSEETICSVVKQRMADFTLNGELDPPHHVPADSPFIRTLADCYELYTGRKSECRSMGGGTYVHGIPGGVAFGASMPEFVSNLHAPDERVNVADLLTASKIFTQVIAELCQ